MITKVFLLLPFLVTMVTATHNQRDMALIEDLTSLLSDNGLQYAFDVDDEDVLNEVQRIFDDHGYDSDELLSDGILSGFFGLFGNSKAQKWAPLQFSVQISCYQGKSTSLVSAALYGYGKYNGYGCYCGSGSYSGKYLDATDLCCKIHDECYSSATAKYKLEKGCHTYTTSYSVSCCEDERITKCTDTGPSAGRALCECDQAAARCYAQKSTLASYNTHYMHNRTECAHGAGNNKVRTLSEILATCKHAFKARNTFKQTVASQGKCPAKKPTGWFWRK